MTERFEYYGQMLSRDFLALRSPNGDSVLDPTTLLVAIDDTGDPTTGDPNHPVFGLGGCAVLVGQYHDVIRLPWARMKRTHFGGPVSPLHASDLRTPSAEQISALNAFFAHSAFFRIAALTTRQFKIPNHLARLELTCLVLGWLLEKVGGRVPFTKVAIVFDASERLNPELSRIFKEVKGTQQIGEVVQEIPVEFYQARKDLCEPLVEVADFVMHTAGRAVRHSIKGGAFLDLPDFRAVFATTPPELGEFIRIDEVSLVNPVPEVC